MIRSAPEKPWEVLESDVFYFKEQIICFINYFSRFVEICLLLELSTENTINTLKSMFAGLGIPSILLYR